jgi:hypothetical protein
LKGLEYHYDTISQPRRLSGLGYYQEAQTLSTKTNSVLSSVILGGTLLIRVISVIRGLKFRLRLRRSGKSAVTKSRSIKAVSKMGR